jgi:hypothetical protein
VERRELDNSGETVNSQVLGGWGLATAGKSGKASGETAGKNPILFVLTLDRREKTAYNRAD